MSEPKVVRVEITTEDGAVRCLKGESAAIWIEDPKFPGLPWEVREKPAPVELLVDPKRQTMLDRKEFMETGYFVRAKHEGRWGNHDIVTLTKDSLTVWLRSRGGANDWAESVIMGLFGHSE